MAADGEIRLTLWMGIGKDQRMDDRLGNSRDWRWEFRKRENWKDGQLETLGTLLCMFEVQKGKIGR